MPPIKTYTTGLKSPELTRVGSTISFSIQSLKTLKATPKDRPKPTSRDGHSKSDISVSGASCLAEVSKVMIDKEVVSKQ
jgi:hypothetical protein